MGAPRLHLVDANAVVARDRDVLIGAWWHSATLAHVAALREATREILGEYSSFATAVLVLDGEGVFSFPEDVRRGMTELVRETEATGVGTAFVFFRGGFVGAAIRAFATGVFLVSGTKEPNKAFAATITAATWLVACLRTRAPTTTWTPEDLDDTLRHVLATATEARAGE